MGRKLSIILPCLNEAGNIRAVVEALLAEKLQDAYEIELVFVDDGSTDATWQRIREVAESHPIVRGVRLSRNFGQQAAILAGLRHATGDAVISMDADLQHPPALLKDMIGRWEKGAEIVTTMREFGPERFWKRLTSAVFYKTFRFMTGLPIASGQADYRLFDRRVVNAILTVRETGMFLRGLVVWIGFRQEQIRYSAPARLSGDTKYTWRRMGLLALEGMFSFSNVPLRIGFVIGFVFVVPALVYAFYAFGVRILAPDRFSELVSKWAALTSLLSFFFGLLFLYLGILGEYLARVYLEAKGRPLFIVAETTHEKAG